MREPAGLGLAAQVVAVVEEHGAARLHREQRPHVPRHRAARAPHVIRRIRRAQRPSLLEREPGGDVALERIVRRCLIGRSIGLEAAAHQRGMHFGRVPDEPDTERAACRLRLARPRQRLLQAGRDAVAVAGRVAPLRARCVHLHRQAHATVHRDRERLCSSHAAEAGREHDASRERAAEVTRRALGEGLERALHDALRADVDPRPGCHLAEHHEALALELPEMLPGRPARHQQRVGDQNARGIRLGAEDADRLARLDQQRLVVLEGAEGFHDALVRLPAPRRLASSAVHHEILGALGHIGIQVVHQHAQRRLLDPAAARPLGAARRAHHASFHRAHDASTSSARRSGSRDRTQRATVSQLSAIGRSPSGAGARRRTAP